MADRHIHVQHRCEFCFVFPRSVYYVPSMTSFLYWLLLWFSLPYVHNCDFQFFFAGAIYYVILMNIVVCVFWLFLTDLHLSFASLYVLLREHWWYYHAHYITTKCWNIQIALHGVSERLWITIFMALGVSLIFLLISFSLLSPKMWGISIGLHVILADVLEWNCTDCE